MKKFFIVECPECGSPVLGTDTMGVIQGVCRSEQCGNREISGDSAEHEDGKFEKIEWEQIQTMHGKPHIG